MNWSKTILLLLIVFSGYVACKKTRNTEKIAFSSANYNDYNTEWRKVEVLEKKGLGKIIITKVDSILTAALREENTPQIFKALAYRSKYANRIEEESTFKILSRFETQIEKATFPLKQLLHSATAELYFQYYNQNRRRFQHRTQTINFDKEDLKTWSLQDILSIVNTHYETSLFQKQDLLCFPTENLSDILQYSNNKESFNGSSLRPNLYDFLADRALNYYLLNEGRVTAPQEEFNSDEYAIFSPLSEYLIIDFNSNDSSSNQLKTTHLFQKILKVHQEDEDPKILIDFNLKRLDYYYSNSQKEGKDSLYLTALQTLSEKHPANDANAEIDFRIAKVYSSWGNEYTPKNKSNQWYLKKTREVCLKHVQKETYGGNLCEGLLLQIQRQEFNFQVEKIYLPSEKIIYRLQHKNIDSLHFRLIKVSNTIDNNSQEFRYLNQKEQIKRLYQLPALKTWVETIKNLGDYQSHSSELLIDELPRGKYILIVSNLKGFDPKKSEITFSDFVVSQLSHIKKQVGDQGNFQAFVLDRKSGAPINKAKVIAYTKQYDYNTRKNHSKKIGEYFSDRSGNVKIITNLTNQNIRLAIISKKDTLISKNAYYGSYKQQNKTKRIQTHFFTDRAIYRPGQTVYFKGIVIEKGHHHNKLQQNFTTLVSLINKNGERLQKLTLKTNDYGSFKGSFILPSSGLNGTYRLRGKHGATYFSVEEYKRPTFEIRINTNSVEAKINTQVAVSGNVIAYSGANVSDAKISYRITRKASFPYWRYWRGHFPSSNSKEIKNGKLSTDSDGNFNIQFFAQADESIDTKWNPKFNFEITIDATSPSGETQSLSKTVSLGSQGFYLSTNIDRRIQLKELQQLVIAAKNSSNKAVDTKADLSLWKLNTPSKIQRKSYWESVDFKHSSLKNTQYAPKQSDDLSNFKKGTLLLKGKIHCNHPIDLFGNISPGAYALEIKTKDKTGKEILYTQRFILFDENSKRPSYPIFSTLEILKGKGEPGENASFLISTGLKNLRLLYQIENDGKIVSKKWLSLNNEQRKIIVPIKEEYRGNFNIQLIGIHSNRSIEYKETITVPYTNKKLQLTLGTYRNKVQPGSKEKWTMTISGMNGEKVAAELLAGMYDQSLDQFKKDDWSLLLYPNKRSSNFWSTDRGFTSKSSRSLFYRQEGFLQAQRYYPQLNWFGFHLGSHRYNRSYFAHSKAARNESLSTVQEVADSDIDYETGNIASNDMPHSSNYVKEASLGLRVSSNKNQTPKTTSNPVRSDFRETAFFYPQLRTDETGKLSFEFKMPDALTQWKFRALAHSNDLKIGRLEASIRTQKELMVTPSVPRFFREKDQLNLKAIISNLSSDPQNGLVKIRFYDAFTNEKISLIDGSPIDQAFNILPGKNQVVFWKIKIPKGIKAIKYEILAQSERFSDGEEKVIPVLSNRSLITESLPLAVRGNQMKQFSFDRLINNTSKTLQHHSYSLEFTANPAWYALQALPYMVSSSSECSEQVFARLYANSIAEKIANSNPRIQEVFKLWKSQDSEELTSKLMQNKELKTILIEETPWLQEARSESEQKKRIALLFDFNTMKSERKAALQKLKQLQLPNGGWSWYKGMRDNRHMTQYIINGFGHLKKLGIDYSKDPELASMVNKGLDYLDQRIIEDYRNLEKYDRDLSKNNLSQHQIHYLYTRSFFLEKDLPKDNVPFQYFLKQAKEYWLTRNLYMKGMIALAVMRFDSKSETPALITASLKDNALQTESLGMYWKKNRTGYYWYNSAIETQALMIEVFHEIAQDKNATDELKIWLLKQKQTQKWSNSKSTAVACYALLMDNLTLNSRYKNVFITVGKKTIEPEQTEAGTGYFKKVWPKEQVNSNLGSISVHKTSNGISWGAAYWQYYEDLDQITAASVEELSIQKNIFKVIVDGSGESMTPIDISGIQIGDKIRIRLSIESKRDLEFVHLKDMRASGFEPINVLSSYKYQDGLGYYESTKDASTNFFMDRLNKGTYVFEYDLRATVSGSYSNGISSLQCQYAPEFNTHSKGKNIKIQD
ncbi:MAG: hypothetical protein JKY48_09370 [Flavobacteriales bacterium]|nr:hypothetical protein [Flavobacteriales bacterium]